MPKHKEKYRETDDPNLPKDFCHISVTQPFLIRFPFRYRKYGGPLSYTLLVNRRNVHNGGAQMRTTAKDHTDKRR